MRFIFLPVALCLFVSPAMSITKAAEPMSENGSIGNFKFKTEQDQNKKDAEIQREEEDPRQGKRNLQRDLDRMEAEKEKRRQIRD